MNFSKSWRVAAALLMTAFVNAAAAQQFPSKPVRIILPYSAGSGPDAVIRHVGDKLAHAWGQPIIIDNRPGANGWIAIEAAKKSPPDGHTLVLMDNSHLTLQPHLYKHLPFDPVKDFEPVAALFRAPFLSSCRRTRVGTAWRI